MNIKRGCTDETIRAAASSYLRAIGNGSHASVIEESSKPREVVSRVAWYHLGAFHYTQNVSLYQTYTHLMSLVHGES